MGVKNFWGGQKTFHFLIELIFKFYQKKKSIESLENSLFCVGKKLGSRFHFFESKWTLSFKEIPQYSNVKSSRNLNVFVSTLNEIF